MTGTTPVTVNLTDEQIADIRSGDASYDDSFRLLQAALPDPTPERTEYRLTTKENWNVYADERLIHAGDLRNGDRVYVDGEWRAVSEVDVVPRSDVVGFNDGATRRTTDLCSSLIVRPAGVS